MKLFTAYNEKNFICNLSNGETIILQCYTTNTCNGFTHQCFCLDFPNIAKSRISYFNRTWEAFDAKLNAFRGDFEALSDIRKEFIKGLYPNGVNSITEAENVMEAAKIFNVLDAICK